MCRKMKVEHFLTPHMRINSKWIKDLNGRLKTIKIIEENIAKSWTLLIAIFDWIYLPIQGRAEKINKWDYIKLKNFAQQRKSSTK